MLLYSGLRIAELTRTSLTNTKYRGTHGTEEHEEQPTRDQYHGHTPHLLKGSHITNTKGAKAPNCGVEQNTICYSHSTIEVVSISSKPVSDVSDILQKARAEGKEKIVVYAVTI